VGLTREEVLHISLLARVGLSEDDVNRMVKEAEAHAEEDRRRGSGHQNLEQSHALCEE